MDYRDVGLVTRGVFDPGKLRIQEDGVHFKSVKTGKTLLVRQVDVVEIEWLRVAKGYEMKLITVDGQIKKFDGFKESDYGELKDFFKTTYRKEMREVDLCVKGWNWGEATVNGSLLSFMVDSKRAFEVPLKEVSQVTAGKNEVTLEFHQNEEASQCLVEMRLHMTSFSQPDQEEDNAKVFAELCLMHADVMQAVGDAIMEFAEIQTLTPRGRYSIKPYPSFLQLHGKTFDYKIPYNSVTRLFLLPHNDQKQMFFVLALDPPIKQGQTRYYFIIFLLPTDVDDFDITLNLSEEELAERYGGRLTKNMRGSLYEVFSRVMRALVNKKITVPGPFKNSNEQCAISCSNKATSGYLYPLDNGFIFVPKPAVYIKFDAIVSVNFARMTGSAGISRSFDFELELRDGNVIHFSSIMKEDYTRLHEFVTQKKIRIKNNKGKQVQAVAYEENESSGSEHDPYLERMKAEGDNYDSEDEDSDFVAKPSGSEDELEYDSEVKISGSDPEVDDSEEEERVKEKTRKRKREPAKASKPAKKSKEETTGRKKRAKKDPNAPKKPLSAYMLWLQENRQMIKKENPGASLGEIGKRAGELWKALGSKIEWEDKAKLARKAYDRAMAEYRASTSATTSKSPKKKTSSKVSKAKGGGKGRKVTSQEYVSDDDSEDDAAPAGGGGDSSEDEESD